VKNISIKFASFLQAIGIIVYCLLVAIIFWKGNEIFGKMNNYLGPVLLLSLLSFSVLVCGILAFGYPFKLFWIDRKPKDALNLVFYMAGWLGIFVLLVMLSLVIF